MELFRVKIEPIPETSVRLNTQTPVPLPVPDGLTERMTWGVKVAVTVQLPVTALVV